MILHMIIFCCAQKVSLFTHQCENHRDKHFHKKAAGTFPIPGWVRNWTKSTIRCSDTRVRNNCHHPQGLMGNWAPDFDLQAFWSTERNCLSIQAPLSSCQSLSCSSKLWKLEPRLIRSQDKKNKSNQQTSSLQLLQLHTVSWWRENTFTDQQSLK